MKVTNRLKIYDLLYSHPLINYAKDGRINVLICGENDIALEIFKAIFWCGQHPDYELQITIHTSNMKAIKASLCNDMPALSLESHEYAEITITESVPDISRYDCVFMCSESYAEDPCKNMKSNTLFVKFEEGEILYSETEGAITKCYYNTSEVELDENDLYIKKLAKFKRIAFNIHFSYELASDQRCGVDRATDKFNDYYNYISSFAAAAHIPYKLSLCKEKELEEIIVEKSSVYNTLLALEHKRWVAYQITEGYQMPTDSQLEEYAYLNGNDHKNKLLKLHPCMCKCGNNGRNLPRCNDDVWDKNIDDLDKSLSELDVISIKLYQIASRRAEKLLPQINTMLEFVDEEKRKEVKSTLINFRASVRKLINNEENSIIVYKNQLGTVKKLIERDNSTKLEENIKSVEKVLSVVEHRNKREDFFANDEQSIQMLPFCLSYDSKNSTVVTFSSNNLYEDAIVPTMLMPNRAIFIGENTKEQQYKSACDDYFSSRGIATVLYEKKIINTVQDAILVLTDLKEKYGESLVINCSGIINKNILLAIGSVCIEDIPVLTVANGELINLNNLRVASYRNMYLTADELLLLQGSSYNNYLKLISVDKNDTKNIENIFWEANQEQTIGKRKYNLWATLSNFFSSASKTEKLNLTSRPLTIPKIAQLEYTTEVFDERNIRAFLHNLNEGKIIRNLNINSSDDLISANFEYVDEELIVYLKNNQYGALSLRLGQSPQYHKLDVNNIVLYDDNDPLMNKKMNIFKMMEENNLISDVYVDGNKCSFRFKNQFVKNVFATQGKILELIVYRKLQDSGLFNDVQTNVEIVWEKNNAYYSTIVMKEISKICESKIGITSYKEAQKKATEELQKHSKNDLTNANEIDVVAIKGFSPYFISCKSGSAENMYQWVNEIAALSAHFKARPILVVGFNLNKFSSAKKAVLRGAKMGVSVLGSETVKYDEHFKNAMKRIISGETVIGYNGKEDM